MTIRRHVVDVVTDEYGDAEVFSPRLSGKLISIRYAAAAGEAAFDQYVDFALTAENTGETIWSEESVDASASRYPRAAAHTTAGAAATYDGSNATLAEISLSQDRVKIVVADGGDAKSGTFHLTMSD